MERNWKVYKHTSPSGKVYIGITCQKPNQRWKNGKGYKSQVFYNAIEKYGWDNIKHEIVAEGLTQQEAEQMEIELIVEYKSNESEFGYNIDNGGSSKGKTSDQTKKKLSELLKGENNPMYGRTGDLNPFYGKSHSEVTKEKIRKKAKARYTNKKHPMLGKHLSEETKQKLREKAIGRKSSAETRQKMSESHKGFNHSKEVKEKISKNRIGKHARENHRMWGKNHSEETKQKMIENNAQSKRIACNNMIFLSISRCAKYYGIKNGTMSSWLRGDRPTPQKFKDLGLRYATEEDLQKYPVYIPE